MKLGSLLLPALAPFLAAGFRPAYPPDLCSDRINFLIMTYAPMHQTAADACYEEGNPSCLVDLATENLCGGEPAPPVSSAAIVFALL